MDIPDINDPLDMLRFLRESGILDRDPYLKQEWIWAWQNQDYSKLESYLESHPGILLQAKRLILEEEIAEEENPYLPHPTGPELDLIDGEIRVGWVNNDKDTFGIDEKDFTEIVFICGRTGCGKSNVIRLIASQFLYRNGE